jgi:hypothetical protein
MSRSKKSIERLNLLGGMMTAAEVKRLKASQFPAEVKVLTAPQYPVLDATLAGAARLVADMGKIGVENLSDLIELARLRKRPIPSACLHDYRWIHSHVCEYLKQFHPADNQALLEQAASANS